uniref:CB1 cannabinoid receptor-interacting protein 1 n=1 Tax=Haptolina brevifila TaxID=156173 RepID=A0A7S2D209_9EUKA|mmetsp:Transcript_32082/g.64016  ORF Transcript_32082/g.64016 Transcript_32082/m.64016 type:complete len:198 (+) Transcript_32082:134-727(+)
MPSTVLVDGPVVVGMPADVPAFNRVTIRLRDTEGGAVRFQDEKPGRGFNQPQSLKLVAGDAYVLHIELQGGTVDGVEAVMLDDASMDISSSEHHGDVVTIKCPWRLSVWHYGTTLKGSRDSVPISITYMHAGKQRQMVLELQCKFYDRRRPKEAAKAKHDGKCFNCATLQASDSDGVAREWLFEEMPTLKPMVHQLA